MEMFTSIGLGVVSGLLTTALIFVLGLLVAKAFIPWYQQLIYNGIDLKGDWIEVKDLEGIKYQYQLNLEQSAHKLAGTMTLSKTGAGNDDYIQPFNVVGSTWEGYVTLNFQSKDSKSLSFATSLLTVNNLGNNLKGYLVYRSRNNNEVGSEEIQWKRSG